MNRVFATIALQSVVAAAIIAAAPLAAAGTAAGSAAYVDPGADHVLVTAPFVSTVSREQVRAEAIAAAHQPLTGTDHAPMLAKFVSTVSRAQVHAEAVEAARESVTIGTESQREMLSPEQLTQIQPTINNVAALKQ
jgi:hypothetical protein